MRRYLSWQQTNHANLCSALGMQEGTFHGSGFYAGGTSVLSAVPHHGKGRGGRGQTQNPESERERDREADIESETTRQRKRERDGQTHRDRQTERQTDTVIDRERQTGRQAGRDRDKSTERQREKCQLHHSVINGVRREVKAMVAGERRNAHGDMYTRDSVELLNTSTQAV